MRIWFTLWMLFIIFVPGCFLSQSPPPATKANFGGQILIEDRLSVKSVAVVLGIFWKDAKKTISDFRSMIDEEFGEEVLPFGIRMAAEPTTPVCEWQDPAAQSYQAQDTEAISAGKMELGTALQGEFLDVPEDANHAYYRELSPGLTAGKYQIALSGAGDFSGRSVGFSVPETVTGVKLNGVPLLDGVVVIKRGTDLLIEWSQSQGEALFQVSLIPESGKYLECFGREKVYPQSPGKSSLLVPSATLTLLRAQTGTEIKILRANLYQGPWEDADIRIYALKTIRWPAVTD